MSSLSFWLNLSFAMAIIYPFFSNGCPADERNYLLHFKGALTDPSGRLSSWQGYNCCEWMDIRCDSHSGHVIRLDLKNGFLSGTIHPSLFKLQNLRHLDLRYNDFSGTPIPPQLANLQRLTFLSLADAGFGGEVPLDVGNITTLRHLDLAGGGVFPLESRRFAEWIQNLRRLEYLSMSGVKLSMASDNWGNALNSLPNLSEIHLSRCGLSGRIHSLLNLTRLSHLHLSLNLFDSAFPAWFQNVTSLVSVDLSYSLSSHFNNATSIPSDFLHRSSLRYLDLSNNWLAGNLSFLRYQSSSIANLYLHQNRLDGIISLFFVNFTQLKSFLLSDNHLTGDIPLFFVNFTELQVLSLANNYLTGDIPLFRSDLENISQLSIIDLSGNKLTGNIPPSIGSIPLLKSLNLQNNQLSGKIPDTLLKSARLEFLVLSSNNLTGRFPLSLMDGLTRLRQLSLSKNSFTVSSSPSWIPMFAHLESLGLSSCNIEGDFPAFLSTQYSLIHLDLSDNKITGEVPNWLWDLPALDMLILSNNQLQGSLPSVIRKGLSMVDLKKNKLQGTLPSFNNSIYSFDVSDYNFTGSIPATMYAENLVLSSNNLTGEIPPFCTNGSQLEILDLSKNNFTGNIPPNLVKCNGMTFLNLAENDLQGHIPEQLGKLSFLQTLNLYGNNLKTTIPSSIVNCTYLEVLDVGSNQIEGNIPVFIGELRNLRILGLASNKFQGTVPAFLLELKSLQILDLSHNCLSGPIPEKLGYLDAMASKPDDEESEFGSHVGAGYDSQYNYVLIPDQVTLWVKGRKTPYEKIFKAFRFMDLSNNKLSGFIPPEVGLLKSLNALNFSRNNLSGSIPESMGTLAELESLDLSGNRLSGKIPLELLDLTFLEVLDVSDNNLSGLIPQGKQFATFEASSFAGNADLHGPPLENRTKES